MKKVLNNLFYFVVGGIICTSIGVYATISYQANQINYNNTTLDHVLDDLYTASNAENYTFTSNITPSSETQTFQTTGKRLTNNVVVNPIPSAYKYLSTSTTVTAENLIQNVKAYNSNGELITGTHPECTGGTFVVTNAATTNAGQIFANFSPSIAFFKSYSVNGNTNIFYYNSSDTNGYFYQAVTNDAGTTPTFNKQAATTRYLFDGKFGFRDLSSDWVGRTVYAVACK